MKSNKYLTKILNLNYLKYGNKTVSCGEFDLPALYCNIDVYPDYIALYGNKNDYHKTENTAVCFYQYDGVFDGKNGLFGAIYFDDKDRLEYFKDRFKGVKFIITPDYSILGDIHNIENIHRIFRARIVAIWFVIEIDAIAIPNISFSDEKTARIALKGLEMTSVIAISTKGHIQDPIEKERLKNKVKLIVDTFIHDKIPHKVMRTKYGIVCEFHEIIKGLNGKYDYARIIASVQKDNGQDKYRIITAYPDKKEKK